MIRALLAALVLSASVSLCSAASLYSGLTRGSMIPPAGPRAVLSASSLETPEALPQLAPVEAAAAPAIGVEMAGAEAAGGAAAAETRATSARAEASGSSPAGADDERADDAGRLEFDNAHVSRAIEAFHPSLPAGKAPAVAARVSAVRPEGAIPSDDDMQKRMQLSPLTNPEREAAVISLYQSGGAAAQVADVPEGQAPRLDLYDAIQRQDAGEAKHNLIVVKKGRTDRIVVVGAHHDKVDEGAGTIDNWTGATMVTNLYQAMKDLDTEATFVFVAFAREEEGLLGSQALVDSLSKEQLARIDSMVNLDTLGVDGTFSWGNNSTRSLLDLAKEAAAKNKLDLHEITLWGGDADSTTFRKALIAAVTIFGASPQVIWDIIHSPNDTIASFSLPHYRNAYLLTLALLKTLDRHPVKTPVAI